MVDLVILNARLLVSGKVLEAGVAVDGGKIVKVAKEASLPKAGETVSAKGNYILPGMIDTHVHLREPGMTQKEGWKTGSSAAAAGGVTTVFDMPNTKPPTTSKEALFQKKELAEDSIVDYGLYFGATDSNLGEIDNIKDIAGVKFFMGESTGSFSVGGTENMLEYLRKLAEKNIISAVHCEDAMLLEKYSNSENKRPPICEIEAIAKAVAMAKSTGARLHVLHVSTREGMLLTSSSDVTSEVTPHHLFLTTKDLEKLGAYGKCYPPLRSPEHSKSLIEAVSKGLIDTIGSDHAPHTTKEKESNDPPAGMPGLETTLPLLLDTVNKGVLSLDLVIKMTSKNPAKIFGVKNKGSLKEGFDADLVIVDMKQEKRVDNDKLFTKCGWSPFDGRLLKGWPVKTFVRGNLVYDGEQVIPNPGKEIEFT